MRRRRSSFSSAGASGLALLALTLPLSRGGVDLWAEAGAVVLALLLFALATARDPALPRPALLLMGVLAVSAVQLLPVPPGLHPASPGALSVFATSLAPLGLYPATRPLSLDPAASARELAKAIVCTAVFAAAWTYADKRRRRDRVLLGLALSGVAVAAVVLGAALVGMGRLVVPRFPFVNPNHLAGFLNLSAFVALGLALRSHGQARAIWLMGFASAGAVSFLSLSRGGIAAFLFGGALFVAMYVRSRRAEQKTASPLRHGILAGGLALALAVAALLALDPLVAEMGTIRIGRDQLKLHLWGPALSVVRDFPLLGVGRGAFATVFTAYQSESGAYTFTHVENEWIQAVADLGIPGGLLLVGTFLWIWLAAVRRRDLSSTEIGLLAGTGALAAHNVFDFSLGILGVAVPFAIAMGLLARGHRPVRVQPWILRAGIAAAFVAAVAGLAVAKVHGGEMDPARVARAGSSTDAAAAAREAARWHPADWVPHAEAGARLAAEARCAEALPWLLRAMTLDPFAPGPHLSTARCLAGRNDVAAKREYRLAITFGMPALPEAATRYPALEDLFDVAPGTPDGLLLLGSVLEATRPRDAEVAYRRALDDFSDDRALLPLARVCVALGDHEGSLDFARRHVTRAPGDPAGWSIAATALFQLGREADARAELERGLAASPGSPALLNLLANRAMAAGRWSEARRLAEEIAPRSPSEIADKQLLAARALAGQGRLGEALDRARSAAGALPGSPGPLLTVAAYAAQAGRYDDAIAALQQAAALPNVLPGTYSRRIAELEAARTAEEARTLERRALHGTGASVGEDDL